MYKRKKDKPISFWTYESLIDDARKWWEENMGDEPYEHTKLIEHAICKLIRTELEEEGDE